MDLSFARMEEQERVNAVRFMIIALSARPGGRNELNEWDARQADNPMRKRYSAIYTRQTKTTYAIQGTRLCRNCFAAVVQLKPDTVNQHAESLSKESSVSPYSPNLSQRRKGFFCSDKSGNSLSRPLSRPKCYALPYWTGFNCRKSNSMAGK